MYKVSKNEGYLLVKFLDDIDYPMIRTAIHHETMLREYPDTNDIWLIGKYHAHVHLGEIDLMVKDFECRCPHDAKRTRTAVVVDEGLTGAIIELWVRGLQKRVSFEIRIFRTLEDAKEWLGVAEQHVA